MPVDPTNQPDGQTWIITLDTGAPAEELRRAIEQTGFKVQQFLLPAEIFIVQGTEAQADKVRSMQGVHAVEQDLVFDVGPPDAAIS